MAGFVRRFGFSPGVETITLIEGVVIVDLPPPGAINGISSGTVGMVGEFADMRFATVVDSSGVVTTRAVPVEITSGQDMLDKVGGFDSTLGMFGGDGGNGFEALRNKTFSRLILVPVNLASAAACRAWRELPTNLSATQAIPAVSLLGGRVEAGREFIGGTGVQKVKLGTRVNFTALGHYKNAIDGVVVSTPAVTAVIGDVTRVGTTVTVTVVNSFFPGQVVNLTPGEVNFPAGQKTIATATGANFTYAETGAAVSSTVALTYTPASQKFTSATGAFLTAFNGGVVPKGTIVVFGQIGGAGALGANAYTLRVTTDAALDTELIVEQLDGSTFNWTAGTALPYRIHNQTDADSGGTTAHARLTDAQGYTLPCRPITSTVAAATTIPPTLVPAAATATSWDSLSGLKLRTHPTTTLVFTAAVQAVNVTGSGLDATYQNGLDSLLQDVAPARDVNIVFAARTTAIIRAGLRTHTLNASTVGLGREACVSPDLLTISANAATADTTPGVGATRNERVIYCWPGVQTFMPEGAGFVLNTADGLNTSDGIIDTRGDGWMAAVLSRLPPERNPGQAGEPVATVLSPILSLQRGLSNLSMGDYINLRKAGVAGLRIDRTVGPVFQSGVTSSLITGQKNIARRRMADFIQDSVAQSIVPLSKQPLTQDLKDSITGEIDAFLQILLSPSNPPAQRIVSYSIDDKSGNTDELEAQGIFVVIGKVRTLASADFIVFQTNIGEGVVTTTTN